jgi:hypothetical protein
MTVEWQRENPEGTLWSATMTDGQQGWFEIQIERNPDGWDWVVKIMIAGSGAGRTRSTRRKSLWRCSSSGRVSISLGAGSGRSRKMKMAGI